MTNADKFKSLFGLYATELWAMPEKDFLKWLNSEVDNCSESPNGWTPCTPETMPKESGKYIVTAYDGNEKKTSYAQYQKRVKDWVLSGRRAYWKVIAWQPLPEPYREGEQDE